MRIALLLLIGCASPDDGDAGAKGSSGVSGADGSDGNAGPPGADGLDGAAGSDGIDGASGVDGADGNDGAAGAPGAQGVPGLSASIGWADAAGVRVLDWAELVYIDEDGCEWDVDPVVATASAKFALYRTGAQIYYDDFGCQGEEWVPESIEIPTPGVYDGWTFTPILPRQPFLIYNGGPDWHVLNDNAERQWVSIRSTEVLGSCSDVAEWGTHAYRYSDISSDPNIAAPALSWVAPLHRVR